MLARKHSSFDEVTCNHYYKATKGKVASSLVYAPVAIYEFATTFALLESFAPLYSLHTAAPIMTDSSSTAHSVFVVLTILSSIFVRVSPFPDFYRIYKTKATSEVAVLPVILLETTCCVLAIYGYLVNNIFPLFVVAVFGIFTSAAFIGIFYKWTENRAAVRLIFGINLLVVVLVVVYTVAALTTSVTSQSRSGVNRTIGWISVGVSIGMFGSPLATIKKVVLTKSAASLPFTMCLTNAINCLLWVVLTLIEPDMFVMIPNVAGAALAIVQVILWFVYRPRKVQAIDVNTGGLEMQICTLTSEDSHWRKSALGASPLPPGSNIELGTSFAALRSPVSQSVPANSLQNRL